MGSAKQRKAKTARARSHQRSGSPSHTDRAELDALFSDEQLLAWGRDLGVELTERSHLLDSAAVGLTIVCWRNTVLEDIHAGGERRDRLDEGLESTTDPDSLAAFEAGYEQERHEFYDRLDADIDSYIAVADPAEGARIRTLLTGRADGFGIPDDVVLRLNASTARQVRDALDATLGQVATEPSAEMPYRRSEVPNYVSAVYGLLEDPDRPVTVGAGAIAAGDLFGPAAWDRYLVDLDRKLALPVRFCDLVGARRALWYAALSGASYARHWFPAPAWATGVASLRAALAAGDFDRVVWEGRYAPPATWAPAADDEAFWEALSSSPERLNGRQAQWIINFSRLRDHLDDAREAYRSRLGPLDTGRFSGIMAMT